MAKTVLIIYDGDVQAPLTEALESKGHEVKTLNLTSVSETLDQEPFDVLIFNIDISNGNNRLLQHACQKSKGAVVFLAATNAAINRNINLDDYVKKPITNDLLLGRVDALLARAEAMKNNSIGTTSETMAITRGQLMMDPLLLKVTWSSKPVQITATEFLLLWELAYQPNFLKFYSQLTNSIYGVRTDDGNKRVKQDVASICWKFKRVDACFAQIEEAENLGFCYRD